MRRFTSLIALAALVAPAGAAEVYRLHDDPALPDDPAEATELLACLQSCLGHQGLEVDLRTLRAISGDAWAPLLQTDQAVFDVLRVRQPLDTATQACEALGVEGRWHTDLTPDEVIALATEELRSERPLIASRLVRPREVSHHLVIGVSPGEGELLVIDTAEPRRRAVGVPRATWSGPIPGPAMWDDAPVFTAQVEERSALPSTTDQLEIALDAWTTQLDIAELPMPDHPGAGRFADAALGDVTVLAGPAAARGLAVEIAAIETLDSFPLLWRVRTLLGQFATRRDEGAAFLRNLEGLDEARAERCTALAASLEATAQAARAIVSLMWNQDLMDNTLASEMIRAIRRDPPLVVDLNAMPGHERELLVEFIQRWPQPWVMERHSTSWGPILTVDSPEQRQRAVDLLNSLADQMEANASLVRELAVD